MNLNVEVLLTEINNQWQKIYSSGRKDMWLSMVAEANKKLPLENKLHLLQTHVNYYPKIKDFLK